MLQEDGRIMQALECLRQMQNELPEDTSTHDERAEWELSKGSNHDMAGRG
jgi:hypothetical protein